MEKKCQSINQSLKKIVNDQHISTSKQQLLSSLKNNWYISILQKKTWQAWQVSNEKEWLV